jgi:hypothetical protein
MENYEEDGGSSVPTDETTEDQPPVPAALRDVDPALLAAIRDKVKQFTKSDAKTISGSEAPVEATAPAEGTGKVTEGKDVDWSEYDLDFTVRHLYPQARYVDTPQGPHWVAMVDEFHSCERSFAGHGKTVNAYGSTEQEPLNLGNYLNDMLNNPEGWRVVSLLPGSVGRVGVLLTRQRPLVLPEPKLLRKDTEVEAPKDPELQREEDAALAFMEREGLGVGPHPVSSLEQTAVALNGPAQHVPNPSVELPDQMAEAKTAAIEASEALAGPDFGDVPAEEA